MPINLESKEIMEKIIEDTGMSINEVAALINAKKGKFAGLLTDAGAAFMVAKELGVKIDSGANAGEITKIGSLEDGMQNVDVLGKVIQAFRPREFEKAGKKGTLCSLVIGDESGEIRLTLWHKDAKRVQEENIQKGDLLLLKNCYVSSYNDRKQLNLGYAGEIEVNPKGMSVEISKSENALKKLEELKADMMDVDTVARVLRIFPATEFSRDGRKGKVLNFQITDGTATMRATAWNDSVDEVLKLSENDIIKIESAYTKEGQRGLELHLGWRARILKNPKINFKIPETGKTAMERKKINQLLVGDKFVEIEAEISTILPGRFHYNVCPKCGKKLQALDMGFVCEKCGQVKEPAINIVVGAEIDDDTAKINAVFYEQEAEKFLGFSKEEMKNKIKGKNAEDLQEEFNAKLKGKTLKVSGFVRANKFNQAENEFIVKIVEFL